MGKFSLYLSGIDGPWKCVIGTRNTGVEEIIQDQKSGILIKPNSRIDLSHAIINILKDNKQLKLIEKNAIIRVNTFDIKKTTRQTIKEYKETIK